MLTSINRKILGILFFFNAVLFSNFTELAYVYYILYFAFGLFCSNFYASLEGADFIFDSSSNQWWAKEFIKKNFGEISFLRLSLLKSSLVVFSSHASIFYSSDHKSRAWVLLLCHSPQQLRLYPVSDRRSVRKEKRQRLAYPPGLPPQILEMFLVPLNFNFCRIPPQPLT